MNGSLKDAGRGSMSAMNVGGLIVRRMAGAHVGKVIASGIGVIAGFVLAMAQVGMMLGWIETATLGITRAEADLWVVGVKTQAFDYGSPIPRQRLYQASPSFLS